MSYDTNFNQADQLKPVMNLSTKGASHAEYQSIKAAIDNWRHMACINVVKQLFIECRDENIAVQ